MSQTSTTTPSFKRGDVREDGRIFWGYLTDPKTEKATRTQWITPDRVVHKYCSMINSASKLRARYSAIPHNLDTEYLVSIFPAEMVCPIMQTPLNILGGSKNSRPSLDKIKPHLGYVKGNVAWISLEANRIKDNASIDVLKRIVTYLEG